MDVAPVLRMRSFVRLASVVLCLLSTQTLVQASGDSTRAMSESALSSEWVAAWRSDLQFVAETLIDTHPAPFHSRARSEFESDLASLAERVPNLPPHRIVVELQQIIAQLKDGHTRLTLPLERELSTEFFQGHSETPAPSESEMVLGHLPIRLGLYSEGLYVQRIERRFGEALGGRVLAIGGHPVEEVMARVSMIIHHDNESTILDHLPARLVIPEVLHAVGLTEGRYEASFEILRSDGSKDLVRLSRVKPGAAVDWLDASEKPPTAMEANFWMLRLENPATAYLKLSEIQNKDDETLREFADRFSLLLGDPSISRAVVDLRGCHGGDYSLTLPLLHALVREERLMEVGRVFVLTDRSTFSAATLFALDLEKHLPVLFAGEPMSGKPKSYGDSRKVQLPKTGLTLRVSTLYWQNHPRDDRSTLPVDLPINKTFEDYRSGRDRVLETVLNGSLLVTGEETQRLQGVWRGSMALGEWSHPLEMEFVQSEPGEWNVHVVDFDASNLVVKGPAVSFDLPIDNGVLRFDAKIRRAGILGVGRIDGREVTLVLDRK